MTMSAEKDLLFVATRRGILSAQREGDTWREVTHGLGAQRVTSVTTYGGVALAGTTEGIYRSDDMGRTWRVASQGLTVPHVRWLAWHPHPSHLVVAGTEPAALFVSQDGGETWSERPEVAELREEGGWYLPYSPEAGCVRGLAFHGDRAYAAVEQGGVLRSDDAGETWRLVKGSSGDTHPPRPGFIHPDVRRPPFDDRRVRRALTMATDREALADVTLSGYAFPATGGFVPPGMPGHSPGIGLPYDPESARRLLAESGYPGGHGFPTIDCIARDDPGHELLCEYLQAQWRASLGIEIAFEKIAWAQFPDRMSEALPHMWMVGYWADYPDPDDYLRVVWWLPPGWQHSTYDRLVEDARRTMDQSERTKLYQRADRILVEEAPILPLCYARVHMLVKPWVRRYLTSPLRWWYWKDVILEPS